jgi:putative drug exporter of the RND superfamily
VPFVRPTPKGDHATLSARWAARVVARPGRYAVVTLVLLGVLAAPAFALRIGFADDGNAVPGSTLRKSYDLVAEEFGPGSNGPVQVAVELGTDATDDKAALRAIGSALAADRGVATVGKPAVNPAGDLAVFTVVPTTSPQAAATSALVQRLRDDVLPDASAGHHVETMLTGATAFQVDISSGLPRQMLLFVSAVIGLSFLVLMMVFRSVLVPLKAAVLNLVSIAAAYGVVVAVFQWGWGAHLIGLEETVPINPLGPILMFAILFGLSMDYEVFLLSRVREEFLRTGDSRGSVVTGLSSTARVITSAALIMVLVFLGFAFDPSVVIKMIGIGLATAIAIDATLVRLVLVPATMALLGDRNWYLPRWLDRVLPDLDAHGTVSVVELPRPRTEERTPEPVG